MGNVRVLKLSNKIKVCVLISSLLMFSSCSFAAETVINDAKDNKTVEAVDSKKADKDASKSLKTTPIRSFFAKFTKKNAKKGEEPVVAEQPAVQHGGIVYTIDDCVKIALKNSHEVKIKLNTYKVQKSNVGIAKSDYFPSFTAGTGYSYQYSKNDGNKTNTTNNGSYGVSANISALIWDFGKTTAKINMNKFNEEAALYDYEYARTSCIFNTKLAYTKVLASRANTDVLAQNVQINKLNVDRTRAMYEVGMKSKIDLVNAESNYTKAKISLLEAQNAYQNALIGLNESMHRRSAEVYSLAPTETFHINKNYAIKNEINVAYDSKNYSEEEYKASIKDGSIYTAGIEKRDVSKSYILKPYSLTMQESIDIATKNRTDLKSMKMLERASQESLKAIKRSYYPALNASGKYGFNKFEDYHSNSVGVYAGLDLPNVNAMSIKNQIERGKSYLEIAMDNVELLETDIFFEIQGLYVDMKQIEEKIPLMKQQVEYALENFELADGRYAVGMGNYIELQQALTDYNNAQLNFVNTVFNYNKAKFSLEKAMNIEQPY